MRRNNVYFVSPSTNLLLRGLLLPSNDPIYRAGHHSFSVVAFYNFLHSHSFMIIIRWWLLLFDAIQVSVTTQFNRKIEKRGENRMRTKQNRKQKKKSHAIWNCGTTCTQFKSNERENIGNKLWKRHVVSAANILPRVWCVYFNKNPTANRCANRSRK